ncbi:MAG: EF-P lysine aminoacylase EpmA [Chlamydiota bacterium]
MSLECNFLARLQDRALMFKTVRTFFQERAVLEVDVPILSSTAPIDPYIDILETEASFNQKGYLHSSPEYGMKKLLAQGLHNIYQMSHVYRKEELSPKHAIEFTMIEWYRSPFSFLDLLEETRMLITLFLNDLPYEIIHYSFALKQAHGIDPLLLSVEELALFCKTLGLSIESSDKDVYLSFLWDLAEKTLGQNKLTFITHFPASQAALSNTFEEGGINYAARFECYHQGLELANGYHELTDPKEQRKRLIENSLKRNSLGKSFLPIDNNFLKALESLAGKDFYGVAVGFDRLMMLRHQVHHIQDILPLTWTD